MTINQATLDFQRWEQEWGLSEELDWNGLPYEYETGCEIVWGRIYH